VERESSQFRVPSSGFRVELISMKKVVTLLTDFGTSDYFVAAMKGVILARNPEVTLIDITHEIEPQDVRAGAFTLSCCYHDFPSGTIHLAVIDPGVGSERRAILVESSHYFFVGPDNGLFSFVFDRDPHACARHVTKSGYFRPNRSTTFHGRDIFAPVAACLSLGVSPEKFGAPINDPIRLDTADVETTVDGTLQGSIVHIDHFGNCVTSLQWEKLKGRLNGQARLQIGKNEISDLVLNYAAGSPIAPFLIVGSAGFIEISVRDGSAAKMLGAAVGDRVVLIID
jgi:S-adenosyl-L-methionine hydrolase (adenosine-forming)